MALPYFKLAILTVLGGLAGIAPAPRVFRETFLMGTTLSMSVAAESRDAGLRATESALVRMRQVDDLLNDWRSDTEMARVNRAAPGAPTRISGELFHIIQEAADWTARSDGAFDPGIGALVDAWDLRGSGRIPADPGLRQAREHSGLARFILDESRLEVQRPHPASWIDAGGFGKGAALRAARDELRRRAVRDAILNFGGQVLVLGDTTVTVEVAHPRQRRDPVARLRVREASVSTTSQSERFVEMGGTRYGHVLDPRTGAPVDAWGSVTVIHPDPMIADILSTALFVMGPEQGLRWVEARDIPALFLSLDGQSVRARWSPALQPLLVSPSFNPEGE